MARGQAGGANCDFVGSAGGRLLLPTPVPLPVISNSFHGGHVWMPGGRH
jgi:hypothetical protein